MKMYIAGKPVDSSDGRTQQILNAATQKPLDVVPMATAADIDRAIEAAQKGKVMWANTPQHERSRILQRCGDAIDQHKEELATLLTTNMGKIIRESRPEIGVTAQIFRGFAEKANHLYGETMSAYQYGAENDIIFTKHFPLGVVACISPFNYPAELCAQKMAAALAAGNAVIVKPASDNPLVIIRIIELCLESGIPGEVLQVLTGSGALIGGTLAKSSRIDAVSLTGSTEVGVEVARSAAKNLKRVFLELGGNDPFIVYADADLELAAREAMKARVQNAGQTCCAPKRFFVERGVHDDFVSLLLGEAKKVRRGSPLSEDTDLGSMVSTRAVAGVEKQVALTISQGAKLLCGGNAFDKSYYEPTVLDGVTMDMDIATDMEVFGPVLPVITFEGIDEVVAMSNASQYGLQAGVMTKDYAKALKTADRLECGSVCINSSGNFRNVDQPFGGWKMSGLGREGISVTLEEMSQQKSYIMKGILG
jgi:NAD-dependent aldehyde dehydrogenases